MITLFTGLPGSGKSYKMVAELWKHRKKYFIIHNIVGFKTEKLGDYGFNWVDYCTQNNISVEEFFSKDYQVELATKIKEKAMNDLQREAFITKVLAELTVDLTVCKLMSDEPLKEWKIYLEKFKKEIDNLYERVSNR